MTDPGFVMFSVEGRGRPFRPARTYTVLTSDATCVCGWPMGLAKSTERAAKWILDCSRCGNRRKLKRSQRRRVFVTRIRLNAGVAA